MIAELVGLREEIAYKFIRRQGFAEIIALDVIAVECHDAVELFFGFNAFNDDFEAEAMDDGDHRADDHLLLLTHVYIANQRPIEFHDVEGQVFHVAKRRIACAKVIESQFDPDLFQLLENSDDLVQVIDQGAFCDLQFEPGRRDARVRDGSRNEIGQFITAILNRQDGQIDTDHDPCDAQPGPLGNLGTGLPDHPVGDRDDQACPLGNRNEIERWDAAKDRMVPAQQRFSLVDPACTDIEDRLVEQLELVLFQRKLQVLLQNDITRPGLFHRILVDGNRISFLFRLIQGGFCPGDGLFKRLSRLANADALAGCNQDS